MSGGIHFQFICLSLCNFLYSPTTILFSNTSTAWCCRKKTPSYCRNGSHIDVSCKNTYEISGRFLLFATYLINRLPNSVIGMQTPCYKLFGKHHNYSGLRILGYSCFPYLRMAGHNKFQQNPIHMCSLDTAHHIRVSVP